MTPEQKLKKEIVLRLINDGNFKFEDQIDQTNIETLYQKMVDEDLHWDYKEELRHGQYETEIDCEYSKHYESKSVGMQVSDGSWIGWTYWYGGGKFGEPEAVEWMSQAYELNHSVEEKIVTVTTFEKKV